ncbi:YfaZ family outer membrane protein [Cronobacter dublinensis]|uniref:YfaZ family outer membrane protein n=1 Tax=Cronobacter dublinensis TaxID=413497 RepID=UPI0024AF6CED|nr:YfaZ family outer membrane protein [Cronobacter dublinensis]MDI7502977.1 YfaZ family outer membrane protein [Cronobacter dublinensis]
MKNTLRLAMASLLLAATQASAISMNGAVGEHYTNLGAGFGTESSGLQLTGNWAHNDDHGDIVGVGLGFNMPLGPFMVTPGVKAIYLNPNERDEGYAAAVGGGVRWDIAQRVSLFGDYYYSPDSLSSGVNDYQEASAGARFSLFRPLSVEAGYRYINMTGKDGDRDSKVADGPYLGVSAGF